MLKRGRRWQIGIAAILGGGILGVALFYTVAWNRVDRVEIVRSPSVPSVPDNHSTDPDVTAVPEFRLPPVPSASDGVDTLLMVGSDSRANLDDLSGFGDFAGARADVIMLLIRPRDQGQPALVSLPRDLWVSTPCGRERVNETLAGCNDMNGESTLLSTVESLTGLGVDHIALVDLAGFQKVVDDLGGYEICLDKPVRDGKAHLNLPAGCQTLDGANALAWLRSRHTLEQQADGSWKLMSGVSDLTRNSRQRQFLIEMMGKLSNFTDPKEALSAAQSIAPYVTVDTDLGLSQAVSLAWTMRGLGTSIQEIEIPVSDYVTQAGAEVLVPAADIESIIANVVAVETVGEEGSALNAG
ncbi:MAG: LCP family protein [Acidimicrobiia bacterium]